jgi:anaerobic magnesium-protoporphyrin IX monomethyl ester cyclase
MKNNKVALISTNAMESPIRTVGGILEKGGIKSYLFNLSTDVETHVDQYPQKTIDDLIRILEEKMIDSVGISIADVFYDRSMKLARDIKTRLNIPVVVGGPHAQLYGGRVIQEEGVDAVCVREAYDGVVNLFRKIGRVGSIDEIDAPNFIIKNGSEIKRDRITLPKNRNELSETPIPITSNRNAYFLNEETGEIIPYPVGGAVSPKHHQLGHPNTVVYTGMWGCANTCNFCHVTSLVDQARADAEKESERTNMKIIVPRVIVKKVDRQIEELEALVRDNPNAEFVNFGDNDFLQKSKSELEHFSEVYPKKIGLPFYCMASPNTVTRKRIELLVNAGLKELNIGIQASEKTNRRYDRNITDKQVLNAGDIIAEYTQDGTIDVFYDFINFNPSESEEDLAATYDLIGKLKGNFDLVIHHLTLGDALKKIVTDVSRHTGVKKSDLIDSTQSLDYHNLPKEFLEKFKNYARGTLYSNLIMDWIAGKHDEQMIGRLPRSTADLLGIPQIKKWYQSSGENLPGETLNALFHPEVRQCLDQPGAMIVITSELPSILYTNQLKQNAYRKVKN